MWTLRIILVLAGVAFVVGVYVYTRRHPPGRSRGSRANPGEAGMRERVEPRIPPVGTWSVRGGDGPSAAAEPAAELAPAETSPATQSPAEPERPGAPGQRVFAVAARWPGEGVPPGKIADALVRAGCTPGEDHIFHCADAGGRPQFSVADLFEPGVLHPRAPEERVHGLVFFFQAGTGPETGQRLDRMIGSARECAIAFGGHVEDEEHRPLTAARELALKVAAAGERAGS